VKLDDSLSLPQEAEESLICISMQTPAEIFGIVLVVVL